MGPTMEEVASLDPVSWESFGKELHAVLDSCLNQMKSYRQLPWKPPRLCDGDVEIRPHGNGNKESDILHRLTESIMPSAMGNTHPRFFGWVNGGGIPICLGAEMIAATMNSNCGGRNHGATKVEEACIRWLCRTAGLPDETSFGVLTTGTSQATILALTAARTRLFGTKIRKTGLHGLPPVAVYAAQGVHSCLGRALEVMGHGSDCIRHVPTDEMGSMKIDQLRLVLEDDKKKGILPLAIVGLAGSVSVGSFDNLNALADICEEKSIWFHVDGAFGYWARIAASPWSELTNGLERVDSVALDTHKWPGITYDCGACLVADRRILYDTYTCRPSYLQSEATGLAAGDTWFTDYTFDLSRGFRALKLWTVLQVYDKEKLGAMVTANCRQAAFMGELVDKSPYLKLAHPVISNICCFTVRCGNVPEIAAKLQLEGKVVFSTIELNSGQSCLRAALVNHRTTMEDISIAIGAVEQVVQENVSAKFVTQTSKAAVVVQPLSLQRKKRMVLQRGA